VDLYIHSPLRLHGVVLNQLAMSGGSLVTTEWHILSLCTKPPDLEINRTIRSTPPDFETGGGLINCHCPYFPREPVRPDLIRTHTHIYIYILWRIDPLLSDDSVNSGRC
jgi:hypothetical protein